MTKKENVYLIFPYTHNGKRYVEAYPVHHSMKQLQEAAPAYRQFTTKKSRNQARRYAYKLWIDATGKGYNKCPISPSMNVPFEEHWD